MKKGIRYLRFSHDKQSYHSIERQAHITSSWINFNKVLLIDTFVDEGYSARNFDRPDIKELFAFIKKNYKGIDFLIVSELTRFSRETGDAINMVKKIQGQYGIRIVSAGRGAIYDCMDHNSFFMMGLEFLMGNSENIKRQNDILGGIYAAKAIKGLWIQGGSKAPYGYVKDGTGDDRRLLIKEEEATIIRHIYEAYRYNTPINDIRDHVKKLGFNRKGHSAIQDILCNPIYIGCQYVKPWKDEPGGIYPLKNHVSIIDQETWRRVQEKLNPHTPKYKISLREEFPLRGILKCHCSKYLTGAPCRGRHGKYYNYYKCEISGHNTLNANNVHQQLLETLNYMSLPQRTIKNIQEESESILDKRLSENRQLCIHKKTELDQIERQLHSVESKWINNELKADTYDRWHSELSNKTQTLKGTIASLTREDNEISLLLKNELGKLSDLRSIYLSATAPQKQELLRQGFDNGLYYQNGLYRTPYMMSIFHHSILILKEKKLLEVDENKKTGLEVRSSGGHRSVIEPLISLLAFVEQIKVA